ncbi:MAG: hypothetical protein NC428_11030 [Clostridium sp.]|nr:hypothetical protein [Clostridium sp.]
MSKKRMLVVIAAAFVIGAATVILGIYLLQGNVADKDDDNYMAYVVVDGFEIPIPDKYMAAVYEGVGLSYCDKSSFEMGISVVEGAYEETVQDLDSMNEQISEWGVLKKEFTEISVGGRAYVYCVCVNEGETILLAFKEADSTHAFQIMVRCLRIDNMKFQSAQELQHEYDFLILTADTLLSNAKPTDKENTPSGTAFVSRDMYSEINVVLPNKFIAHDILYDNAETQLVGYDVEDNFYMISREILPDYYSMKVYENEEKDILAAVLVDESHPSGMSAQDMMREGAALWMDKSEQQEVKSIQKGEHTFYYYTYNEAYDVRGETRIKYYFEAATDLEDGKIYRITAQSDVSADACDINTYAKFMDIEAGR